VPAAGHIFHYSRSQAPPPALPLIDLIGDVLRSGLEIVRRRRGDVSICRHYWSVSSRTPLTTAQLLQSRRRRVNVFIAVF